jgi:hypothetical protein
MEKKGVVVVAVVLVVVVVVVAAEGCPLRLVFFLPAIMVMMSDE